VTNGAPMIEKRGGGIIGAILSLATLLIASFGAGVGYLEYQHAQQRERVERVFRYSDMYAGQADANAKISKLGDDFVTDWPIIFRSARGESLAEPTSEQVEAATTAWYIGMLGADPQLRSAVDQMAQFYDTLAVCITQDLCDEPTAKALFTENVAAFASTVYPWIAHRRKEYFAASGTQAMCLRNRFCGGEPVCDGLPAKLASCQ
jgi:hypothetical protein